MNRFMFGFSAILLSAMLWPSLPPVSYIPYLVVGALILHRKIPVCAGGLFAVAWLTGFCLGLSRQDLPVLQQPIQVRGEIISLVSRNSDWLSLDISLIKPNLILGPNAKLRLTWKDPPEVDVGQVWLFTLTPKSIASVLNQGGYNEQKQLISQHVVGKGRVIEAQLLAVSPSLRNDLISALTPELASLPQGDILLALLLGDKHLISQARWQALRQTGTGHLVAISGLHLSVVAAWVYACLLFGLSRLVSHQSRRNMTFALVAAGIGAAFYAYLAGFGVSTQRALVMILLLMLLSLLKRFSTAWERLLFALFVVLLLDPLACLSAGFWLSFCALGVILYTLVIQPKEFTAVSTRRTRVGAGLLQFWAIQWRLSLGLGLLQGALFGGVSLHSLWMNILAVPWFSFVVIPLAMAGFICWWVGTAFGFSWLGLLRLSDWSLSPYAQLLDISQQLPAHWLALSDTILALGLSAFIGGVLWRYVPKNKNYTAWLSLLSLLFIPALLFCITLWSPVQNNRWAMHLLDVGQGLAVVIEKNGRGLVYDTGAAFGDDFSYAERVILPFLKAKGIQDIDYIVISHSDNDHAGGAPVLIEAYPKALVITDMAGFSGQDCRPRQIQWQGLSLNLLSPPQALVGNNGSCVIRIDDDRQSLLLTGDIEKQIETSLLSRALSGEYELQSEVLVAPHHGSKTSSTEAFIDAVAPKLVLFPAGFANRWGFPKSTVVERYQQREIMGLTTGIEGQISVIFQQSEREVKTYRGDLAPFWYNSLFRFGDLINPE
ncbi:DNA internalization-related competence protein ComEC/Rec2 [Shewanella sp. NKUCC05_KAH]|uniref:DNA internalization-related competence protein ComEC/Rec2 n=1 Tax=unclassified Shewanella TaxID=196818 RepID=UPI0015654A12|nr:MULTISPECIES: DNA internalization-related competence protein ComEC/Rec2 [unclassified Shewanella]MBW3525577.1 DNA internalization-related competence protein ComEC/Rec2 [Shewanella sp. NKUCC05_KAH]MCU8081829.1 DNA internalization-related competence protein ComEC/Rec2 [Shewanella sp. SM23]NRD32434.1 DNA internalization-related competence protein ComEC/Rec2 [Shewanella sp. DC2-4]